jgi:hypothetical protein
MNHNYKNTIKTIVSVCKTIKLQPSGAVDGRLYSALQEQIYLEELRLKIKERYPYFKMDIMKNRSWYDFSVNDLKINLKITDGNTDNIFNKNSIIYTLTGKVYGKNMNWKKFTKLIDNNDFKDKRNPITEYHYLVVFKNNEDILLKSLLDLKKYKKNPSNILQVNWNYEYKNKAYKSKYYKIKTRELLRVIQTSVHDRCDDMMSFLELDFTSS